VIHIQVRENGRLLVPVGLNGQKDCMFLLDTGATTTVVGEKLARKSGLNVRGAAPVHTFAGRVPMSVGVADKLAVGKGWIAGIEVLIGDLGRLFNLNPEIEGILGQDFLSRFNYLVDRRGRKILIEENNILASVLSGTKVSFEARGGKIYVPAEGGTIRLLLDSGNPYLVLYEDIAGGLPFMGANPWAGTAVASSIGRRGIRVSRLSKLEIGDRLLSNVDVVLSGRGPGRYEDGFLPLHFFDSIYVNNLGGFLIVNPRWKQ
jgi:predicted aspartyl protease